jgi:ABC-type branched-subunit amino acid transport system ATPase component/ABC-type branched-subunit amino acid transport system permease subunit
MKKPGQFVSPVTIALCALVVMSAAALLAGMPINRITQVAIYTLYGAGVNLLIGYLGLVPFGASFFFGCASYAVAIGASMSIVHNEFEAIALSAVFSAVIAVVVGLVILRRRGLYFSLLTLACSQIAFEVAYKWTDVTGGENGLQTVHRPFFASEMQFHVLAVTVVIAMLYALWRLAHAPFGRAMQALRDNEQRMTSLGYNPYLIKLAAFTLAGIVIGVAGALMALMLRGAYANNLNWQHAGDAVLMAALGGIHHFLGPMWGAVTFILLEDKLSAITENWWLLFAPIIILFTLLSPEGIHGIVLRVLRRRHWTLTRDFVPPRPERIEPYAVPAGLGADSGPILTVKGLSKRFGSIVTQREIDLEVHPRTLHSLIGPNGAGKSTFFHIVSGLVSADSGQIVFDGEDISALPAFMRSRRGLSRSFQILSVFPNLTAFENVRIAVQAGKGQWGGLWRDAYRDQAANARVWSLLDAVGLADRASELCSSLSHGEKRLLEIVMSLATDAKLLLLDEPLAGLAENDRRVVSDLIVKLARTHAVLLIEHDIDRVLALSDRITVLHQGRLIADGCPAEVASHPEVVSAYLGKSNDPVDRTAAADAGCAAQQRALARPECAGGEPKALLTLERVCGGYDGGTVLHGVDMVVRANEVVALLGRNGVGKTTVLRAAMGMLAVSGGRVVLDGEDVTGSRPDRINRLGISMVPEGRRLFPNLTLQENLKLAARKGGASLDEVCELFPKLKILARSRADHLSGGERQMVAIARALMVPGKVILLDEPFEGLAPAVVHEVMEAVVQLSTRASLVIVEHHAESVLSIADRAYVLVNGRVAFEGEASSLAEDKALQHRLLGIAHGDDESSASMPIGGTNVGMMAAQGAGR